MSESVCPIYLPFAEGEDEEEFELGRFSFPSPGSSPARADSSPEGLLRSVFRVVRLLDASKNPHQHTRDLIARASGENQLAHGKLVAVEVSFLSLFPLPSLFSHPSHNVLTAISWNWFDECRATGRCSKRHFGNRSLSSRLRCWTPPREEEEEEGMRRRRGRWRTGEERSVVVERLGGLERSFVVFLEEVDGIGGWGGRGLSRRAGVSLPSFSFSFVPPSSALFSTNPSIELWLTPFPLESLHRSTGRLTFIEGTRKKTTTIPLPPSRVDAAPPSRIVSFLAATLAEVCTETQSSSIFSLRMNSY